MKKLFRIMSHKMASFHNQFELCAHKYADNNSILFCDNVNLIHKVTYSDLLKHVNIITQIIEDKVVKKSCIGILIEPNPLLPAVILSTQKHGCPFYCFDFNIRCTDIVNTANNIGINYIFTCNLPENVKKYLNIHTKFILRITLPNIEYEVNIWETNSKVFYENISYIIQTSGTTGKNKIVKVQHYCIISNIENLRNIFNICDKDVIYFGTPLTFDPFIVEIMLALTTGAALFIIPPKLKHNKTMLLETLFPTDNKYPGVTFMQMPPSVFLRFTEREINKILCEESSLRILALGGENFPKQLFKYDNWSKTLKIFNMYGITEISCWSSVEEVKENEQNVSLGIALKDTIFQIRNENGDIIENGEGILFIGSDKRICIINNEIITNNSIIFRDSGDVVLKNENKIFYRGRQNNIIKRLGHKVNLSEIENTVYDLTELTSVCIWDENRSKLILFVIIRESDISVKNQIIDRLRIKLLRNLPHCFMPDIIETLLCFPLTTNGKIDKENLLDLIKFNDSSTERKPEEIFQILWSKYFGTHKNKIDKQSNFIHLGGHSILAIQLISEYDSLIKNSYSGHLMAMLLDRNTNYSEYINFIRTQILDVDIPAKRQKLDENYFHSNANTFEIKILWSHNLDACVDSSPVHFIHQRLGDLIAIGSHGQKFVILKAQTGELLSEIILPDAVEGSACITKDKELAIIGCNNGIVYFINVEDGKIVREFKTNSSVKSTPTLTDDNKILFGSYDKYLYCLGLEGNLEWKFEINESIKSNVVTSGNKSYVATINGSYFCILTHNSTVKWKTKSNIPVFSSPCLIEEENLIVWADVKGNVSCFDCDSGDKLWVYKASGFIYSSLYKIGKNILFSTFDHGCVFYLACERQKYVVLFQIKCAGQISTNPCLLSLAHEKFIFVINNEGLIQLFDFENQNLQQIFQLPAEVFSSPTVINNKLFVGCRDNNVYCLELIKKNM